MNILVFVKQIPEVSEIKFDPESKRILREGVSLIINPFDKRAVEEAIRIKEKNGATVTVVSMGPPSAVDVLNRSLRMGADRAILVSDRKFGGSDTLVTSRILADVVKQLGADLILMGKYSLDGETSQVPPEVAELSGKNFKSSVSKIEFGDDEKSITVEQDNERGISRYMVRLPALLSVSEKINRARYVKSEVPDMKDRVEIWDSSKINIQISGKEDSPTVVEDTEVLESNRSVKMLGSMEEAIDLIIEASSKEDSGDEVNEVEMPPLKGSGMILGVAVGDPGTAREIAGKMFELAGTGEYRIDMMGNIDPGELKGMACHSYRHMRGGTVATVADYVAYYIKRNRPAFVVYPSNTDGREIAGTVAARLNLGLTADCVDLKMENSTLVQYKPAFGGGIIARITSKTNPAMATVRPGMFLEVRRNGQFESIDVDDRDVGKVKLLEHTDVPTGFTPLGGCSLVLGVGKGVARKERIPGMLELTNRLGAGLGGTRPIIDFHFMPRQQQVGITGVSISPDLYVALGISGSANHIVGIRYAKKILAVNTDENAPIFKYSDYGLVADAYEFLQKLASKLQVKLA